MSIAIVLTIHTTEVDPHPNPHTISIGGRDFISFVWVFTNPRAPYYFSLQLPLLVIHLLVLHTALLLGIVVSKYTSP